MKAIITKDYVGQDMGTTDDIFIPRGTIVHNIDYVIYEYKSNVFFETEEHSVYDSVDNVGLSSHSYMLGLGTVMLKNMDGKKWAVSQPCTHDEERLIVSYHRNREEARAMKRRIEDAYTQRYLTKVIYLA